MTPTGPPVRNSTYAWTRATTNDQVREVVAALGYTAHIRPQGEEAQAKKAGQKARRWVVERTHSWLNRFRHLLTHWAKKPENYLAMLHFACVRIIWCNYLFV